MKLTDRLERLVNSAVGLRLANSDHKEFVPTAAQAIAKDIRELLPKQKEPQNSEPDTPQRLINRGYNKAILDMEEARKVWKIAAELNNKWKFDSVVKL